MSIHFKKETVGMPVAFKPVTLTETCPFNGPKTNLESGRLESFDDNWPHPDDGLCSKKVMSKAGFYHTGVNDCVKCFVCFVKIEGWDPSNDEPWQKHAELSPNCIFAQIKKEEAELTVEQWLDVFCNQAKNVIEKKFNRLLARIS